MSTGGGGIHCHRPVDEPLSISGGSQLRQDVIPGAISRQPAVPGPHCLPRTETLWQIPPGDPTPVPVDNALNHCPGISEGPTLAARGLGQLICDQLPLSIRKNLETRHNLQVSTTPLPNFSDTL